MKGRLGVLALLVAAMVGWYVRPARSFTTEQATAGRATYEQQCSSCHGANQRQLPEALLAGREFTAKWGGRPASELIAYMRSAMPLASPGSLPEAAYVNVAAYLLQVNGGSADGQALTATTATRLSDGLGRGGTPTPPTQAAAAGRGTAPAARTGVTVAGSVPNFVPVTDQMLRDPKPDDWLMLRHDYSATSYSPLTQLT